MTCYETNGVSNNQKCDSLFYSLCAGSIGYALAAVSVSHVASTQLIPWNLFGIKRHRSYSIST